jgi:tRNA (guanine-N7-)-methyltransferase
VNESVPTSRYQALIQDRKLALRDQLATALPKGKPFVWEIGSGHGHFLTAYATTHPLKSCIGVDLVGERIERAVRKRDRAKLPNLHFIRAEARLFLETLPDDARFSELFILFPDPWPKLRHRKHRILQPGFLAALADHATPDCRLFFRTDFTPYYDEALATLQRHAQWEVIDEPWPFEFETVFQSRAPSHHSIVARRRS